MALTSSGAPAAATVAGSPYNIAPSAATGGTFNPANYTITYQDGALTVNPAALTIMANNRSKLFGETVAFAGTEFTSAGLQNSETVGSVTLSSSGAVATAEVSGSPFSIVPSAAAAGTFNPVNYTVSYQNGTLTVSPAAATVTLSNLNHVYDGTAKSASATTDPPNLAVALTYDGSPNAPTNAGSYQVIGTVVNANYVGSASNTLTIAPAAPPVVTLQPLSRTNVVSSSVTFSVTATGAPPLSFQWRKEGTNVSGATDRTYTIVGVQTNDAGDYSVVVSNVYGGAVTSSVAVLTVRPLVPPTVLAGPVTNPGNGRR